MQIESLEVRVARAARDVGCLARPPTEPARRRPDPGAEGHSALHGGAHDAGKRQGGLGDWVRSARADGVGLEVAAAQEPP